MLDAEEHQAGVVAQHAVRAVLAGVDVVRQHQAPWRTAVRKCGVHLATKPREPFSRNLLPEQAADWR